MLSRNKIYGFSNEGTSNQSSLFENWNETKEINQYHSRIHTTSQCSPCQSGGNLVLKMWGRIIEILFSSSNSIVYKSDDTVLKDVSANFKKLESFPPILKVLLEAKTTINGIISKYQLINPTEVNVLSFRACNFRSDLLCTSVFDRTKYCTARICVCLRVPLFVKLVFYKNHTKHFAYFVKKEVDGVLNRRSSFGKTLGPRFKNSLASFGDWIDPLTLDN